MNEGDVSYGLSMSHNVGRLFRRCQHALADEMNLQRW